MIFSLASLGRATARSAVASVAAALLLAACGGDEGPKGPPLPVGPVTPGGGTTIQAVTFTSGLVNPWGLAFLPDGRLLVTERPGRMRIVSADGATLSTPLSGLPSVHATLQGGLLDVAVDPDFALTQLVYWSYAEDSVAGTSGTAVARGRLNGTTLDNVTVIFRQVPKVTGDTNYGARLVFGNDKTLFVTLGERGTDDPTAPTLDNAQNLANHLGKVVRINRDGTVPADNPYVNVAGALPEVYSVGHRNPQGAALNPASGELWLDEHGPQGGDEVNRIVARHNYGWPFRSYGCPDGAPVSGIGCQIGGGIHFPNYDEPLYKWAPVGTAPSGMLFYTGSQFPEWQGNVFVGALAGMSLWRFALMGNAVGAPEQLFTDLGERIRDVRQGPDGFIYLLTDSASGRIVRLQR